MDAPTTSPSPLNKPSPSSVLAEALHSLHHTPSIPPRPIPSSLLLHHSWTSLCWGEVEHAFQAHRHRLGLTRMDAASLASMRAAYLSPDPARFQPDVALGEVHPHHQPYPADTVEGMQMRKQRADFLHGRARLHQQLTPGWWLALRQTVLLHATALREGGRREVKEEEGERVGGEQEGKVAAAAEWEREEVKRLETHTLRLQAALSAARGYQVAASAFSAMSSFPSQAQLIEHCQGLQSDLVTLADVIDPMAELTFFLPPETASAIQLSPSKEPQPGAAESVPVGRVHSCAALVWASWLIAGRLYKRMVAGSRKVVALTHGAAPVGEADPSWLLTAMHHHLRLTHRQWEGRLRDSAEVLNPVIAKAGLPEVGEDARDYLQHITGELLVFCWRCMVSTTPMRLRWASPGGESDKSPGTRFTYSNVQEKRCTAQLITFPSLHGEAASAAVQCKGTLRWAEPI